MNTIPVLRGSGKIKAVCEVLRLAATQQGGRTLGDILLREQVEEAIRDAQDQRQAWMDATNRRE